MRANDSGYDAFISYSRDPGSDLAAGVQSALQKLAKPWYRQRALRVFRDKTNLAASPQLASSIEQALAVSEWFVLMASPDSARSQWVGREVSWWRANRSMDRFLIALTGGDLLWTQNRQGPRDFDWSRTTALNPEVLRGAFREEPLWVDLRWADGHTDAANDPRMVDAVADLAAPIRGADKDTLVGDHLREHRRAMRWAISAVAGLVVLALLTAAGLVVALKQRDLAREQTTIAQARLLAATSQTLADSRLDLAQLFAAEAYRLDPSAQTRSALLKAVIASPHLVRYLPADGTISATAVSMNGRYVLAGTIRGQVVRWDVTDYSRKVIGYLPTPVSSVSISDDGRTIAATDRTNATIWAPGERVERVSPPRPGQGAYLSSVSPSGRFVSLLTKGSADEPATGLMVAYDLAARRSYGVAFNNIATDMVTSDETHVVTFSRNSGVWADAKLPNLAQISGSADGIFGVHGQAAGISSNGRFFGLSNGGPTIPVWSIPEWSASETPISNARSGGTNSEAVAVSADGKHVAVADTGTVYVSGTTSVGSTPATPTALTGNGAISDVRFVGSGGDRLVSASGDLLALWDMAQNSRIATESVADLASSCNACGGPHFAVGPTGRQLALSGGQNQTLILQGLAGTGPAPTAIADGKNGLALWSMDGTRLFVADPIGGAIEVRATKAGLPIVAQWPPLPQHGQIAMIAGSADGRRIVEVDTSGGIIVRDSADGGRVSVVSPSANLTLGEMTTEVATIAVNPEGSAVAGIDAEKGSRVNVIDAGTGRSDTVGGGNATGVGYTKDYLAILRSDGALEVWDGAGRNLVRTLKNESRIVNSPVTNQWNNDVLEERSDGNAFIVDAANGERVLGFNLPVGWRDRSTTMKFSSNGHDLVTVTEAESGPAQVLDWRFSEKAWIDIACASSGHGLTPDDWRRYVGGGPIGGHRACAAPPP